ncbi:hypothetical protein BCT84_12430 [Vibrio breoganii]|nr:hypothetical protein BCT84_12430 [Vibrio breoganii]
MNAITNQFKKHFGLQLALTFIITLTASTANPLYKDDSLLKLLTTTSNDILLCIFFVVFLTTIFCLLSNNYLKQETIIKADFGDFNVTLKKTLSLTLTAIAKALPFTWIPSVLLSLALNLNLNNAISVTTTMSIWFALTCYFRHLALIEHQWFESREMMNKVSLLLSFRDTLIVIVTFFAMFAFEQHHTIFHL